MMIYTQVSTDRSPCLPARTERVDGFLRALSVGRRFARRRRSEGVVVGQRVPSLNDTATSAPLIATSVASQTYLPLALLGGTAGVVGFDRRRPPFPIRAV
jgi:hypothetical protein